MFLTLYVLLTAMVEELCHEALRHSESLWLTRSLMPQAASTAAADRTRTGTASTTASNGPARRAGLRTPAPDRASETP